MSHFDSILWEAQAVAPVAFCVMDNRLHQDTAQMCWQTSPHPHACYPREQ